MLINKFFKKFKLFQTKILNLLINNIFQSLFKQNNNYKKYYKILINNFKNNRIKLKIKKVFYNNKTNSKLQINNNNNLQMFMNLRCYNKII